MAGQVTDADSGQPVGGAVVTVEAVQIATTRGEVYSPDGVGTSTVADSGEFRLEPIVRANWVWILLNVRRDGYEPTSEWFTQTFSPATPIDELVLAVYPTLIVRPGESIQTRVHLRSYTCGSEPSRCRRILIESAPGEPVEVELVPPTGPNRGLEPYDSFQFAEYKRRVTVSNGEVYVIGEHDDSSPVTLTVRRP